jgi:DNA-binding NarL/FixJ family response regulator
MHEFGISGLRLEGLRYPLHVVHILWGRFLDEYRPLCAVRGAMGIVLSDDAGGPSYGILLQQWSVGERKMKVLLVDDHVLFRDGLKLLIGALDPKVETVNAGNCDEALAIADQTADLDLVLLDLHMPGRGGMEALALLRDQYPSLPVVVMSGDESTGTIQTAIDTGAMGFIPKTSSSAVMLQALKLVLAGGVYVPPSVLARPVSIPSRSSAGPSGSDGTAGDCKLSPRQIEVLALLVKGRPTKLICRELGMAESTAKTHINKIFQTLDVHNRTEAVYATARMGIVLPERITAEPDANEA